MRFLIFTLRVFIYVLLPAVLIHLLSSAVLDYFEQGRERTAKIELEQELRKWQRSVTTDWEITRVCQDVLSTLLTYENLDAGSVTAVREQFEKKYPGMLKIEVWNSQPEKELLVPVAPGSMPYRFIWNSLVEYLQRESHWKLPKDWSAGQLRLKLIREKILGNLNEPETVLFNRGKFSNVLLKKELAKLYWQVITPDWNITTEKNYQNDKWKGLLFVLVNPQVSEKLFGLSAEKIEKSSESGVKIGWLAEQHMNEWLVDEQFSEVKTKKLTRRIITHYKNHRENVAFLPLPLAGVPVLFARKSIEEYFPERFWLERGTLFVLLLWGIFLTIALFFFEYLQWNPWISVRARLTITLIAAAMVPGVILLLGGLRWLNSESDADYRRIVEDLSAQVRSIDDATVGLREELERRSNLWLDGTISVNVNKMFELKQQSNETELLTHYQNFKRDYGSMNDELMTSEFILLDLDGNDLVERKTSREDAMQRRSFFIEELLGPMAMMLAAKENGENVKNVAKELRGSLILKLAGKARGNDMDGDIFSARKVLHEFEMFGMRLLFLWNQLKQQMVEL